MAVWRSVCWSARACRDKGALSCGDVRKWLGIARACRSVWLSASVSLVI